MPQGNIGIKVAVKYSTNNQQKTPKTWRDVTKTIEISLKETNGDGYHISTMQKHTDYNSKK
jgi:hypothetical protein